MSYYRSIRGTIEARQQGRHLVLMQPLTRQRHRGHADAQASFPLSKHLRFLEYWKYKHGTASLAMAPQHERMHACFRMDFRPFCAPTCVRVQDRKDGTYFFDVWQSCTILLRATPEKHVKVFVPVVIQQEVQGPFAYKHLLPSVRGTNSTAAG